MYTPSTMLRVYACISFELPDNPTRYVLLPPFLQMKKLGLKEIQDIGIVGFLWKPEENLSHASPSFWWLLAILAFLGT